MFSKKIHHSVFRYFPNIKNTIISTLTISSFLQLTYPQITRSQTSSFTCNSIYVSVQTGSPTNGYPVGKKFYQLNLTDGSLSSQIGGDATGVTGGIGIDRNTKRIYYIDGNGGSGYGTNGIGRIWYFNGATHINTGHTIADPTAEHQAGTDRNGVLWTTRWTGDKNLYRYNGTGNAISLGPISSINSSLQTEWSSLSEGDFAFDKDDKMWFVSTYSGQIAIWTINRDTRQATKIGNYGSMSGTNHVVTGGAFAPDGSLYIGTSFGHIHKFDPIAKTLTTIKSTTDNTITDMTSCLYPFVSISGTVWRDNDSSAQNTFNNIYTAGEIGTNAGGLQAILIGSDSKVIASTTVNNDGTYSFNNLAGNQTGLIIRLSTTPSSFGATPPLASLPNDWISTSPRDSSSFNTDFTSVSSKDFGIRQKAKLVFIKRITKINGQTTNPNDGTSLTQVINNPATNNDDPTMNWPNNYLVGAVNAGRIIPGNTIEYTIYFLNHQGANARNVKICDSIRGSQSYVVNSMKLRLGSSNTEIALTDPSDIIDRAQSYTAGNAPNGCNISVSSAQGTDRGGIAIDLTGSTTPNQPALDFIPAATGAGTPSSSYGLLRFVTRVDP